MREGPSSEGLHNCKYDVIFSLWKILLLLDHIRCFVLMILNLGILFRCLKNIAAVELLGTKPYLVLEAGDCVCLLHHWSIYMPRAQVKPRILWSCWNIDWSRRNHSYPSMILAWSISWSTSWCHVTGTLHVMSVTLPFARQQSKRTP